MPELQSLVNYNGRKKGDIFTVNATMARTLVALNRATYFDKSMVGRNIEKTVAPVLPQPPAPLLPPVPAIEATPAPIIPPAPVVERAPVLPPMPKAPEAVLQQFPKQGKKTLSLKKEDDK